MVGKQNSFIIGFTTLGRHNGTADPEPGGGRAVPQYAADAEGGRWDMGYIAIQKLSPIQKLRFRNSDSETPRIQETPGCPDSETPVCPDSEPPG